MKNLKTRLEELRQEFRTRIANGEFEVEGVTSKINSSSYLGEIKISIDGIKFHFSLSNDETFICDHSETKINYRGVMAKKELSPLFDAFKNHPDVYKEKEKQIEELKEQLKALQNEQAQ